MPKPRKYKNFCVGLSKLQHRQIEKIVSIEGKTKNEVIRDAIDKYFEYFQSVESEERDGVIEARLKKLENRIANLTVLSTRASAQTLYYITLPFSKGGFPAKPLNKEAFQAQWSKSRYFASQFLKNAQIDPLSEHERNAENK